MNCLDNYKIEVFAATYAEFSPMGCLKTSKKTNGVPNTDKSKL